MSPEQTIQRVRQVEGEVSALFKDVCVVLHEKRVQCGVFVFGITQLELGAHNLLKPGCVKCRIGLRV